MGGTAAIVVNWNAGLHLGRCVEALLSQTAPLRTILIVDNASTDGSLAAVEGRARNVEVLRLPRNEGFARATNIGIRRLAGAEWLAMVNPDAFPHADWLEQLLRQAGGEPRYAAFASLQLDAADPTRVDGAGDVYSVSGLAWRRHHGVRRDPDRLGQPEEVFGPCAAAALYDPIALAEVGELDESFFCYFEDVDLAFRLRLAGHRCLFVPAAVVDHVGSATSGRRSEFTTYHGHRNLVWCWFKNMPAPLMVAYLPHHLLLNLLSLIWLARRGLGRSIRRAKLDALRGLPAVLKRRPGVQRRRRVGSAVLRSQMASSLDALRRGVAS